jgi:hypothetical protein
MARATSYASASSHCSRFAAGWGKASANLSRKDMLRWSGTNVAGIERDELFKGLPETAPPSKHGSGRLD